MRRLLVVLFICLMVATVSAKGTLAQHSYVKVSENDGILESLKKLLSGKSVTTERVYVIINDKVVWKLLPDSPLIDVPIHKECVPYQFPSFAWYNCEATLK